MSLGKIKTKFQNDFILLSPTPEAAILGLYNEANDNYNRPNHILYIVLIYQEKNEH